MATVNPPTVRKKVQRITKEIVGDYTVTTRPFIGSGTFGKVCEAEHNETHIKVAVKEIAITNNSQKNDYMTEMADREFQILQRLKSHTNIVRILDYVLEEDSCWIFMEFCNLGDLKFYLENNSGIDLEAKVNIFDQSASALAFMHRQKPPIIHRDLKLENILMTKQGDADVVKLTDFGLSKVFTEKHHSSFSALFNRGKFMSTACGSHFFLAPEFFAEQEGGLQYDPSIDVFALGLVHKVVLEYSDANRETIPLSVSSKRSKVVVNIGTEMLERYRQNKELPSLVEMSNRDDECTLRIKRIIKHMTEFRSIDRKNVQEVEQEYKEIRVNIFQRQDSGRRSDEVQKQADDIIRLTRERDEERKKRINKEKEIERLQSILKEQNWYAASSFENRNQGETREVQPTISSASSSIPLTKLLAKQYKETNRATLLLFDLPRALQLIDGQLWCSLTNEIHIYNTNLQRERVIKLEDVGAIGGIAEVDDDMVAVAAYNGLVVINGQGAIRRRLQDGNHDDVAVHNKLLYTTIRGDYPDAVHVYSVNTWQRTAVINIQYAKSRHCNTLCVNKQYMFISSYYTNQIYKMSLSGKKIDTYGKQGNGIGEFYCLSACMSDCEDNLLVADDQNNRLQLLHGRQWSVLQLQPRPSGPLNAVYDGNALYVAQWDPPALVKYE